MKRFISAIVSICLIAGTSSALAYSKDDNGKVDLYEVFSNKADKLKNTVGSRVYKWTMYLPDDAIIYKTDRVNYFNMSTKSYSSSVNIEVSKNEDDLTLQEMLYRLQNESKRNSDYYCAGNEFSVNIATDSRGEKYIRIIKSNNFCDFFMLDETTDDMREYVENRIYIANKNIYNMNVKMDGEFYKQHPEMFDKLSASFKLGFDESNPYIKELSDSVSTTREYKNTVYGWKITMNPYWKIEGSPNSRYQNMRPVYSDEELYQNKNKKEDLNEFKVPEGIKVSLISSSLNGEDASKWAKAEVDSLKNNYNNSVYEILKEEARKQNGMDTHHVIIRYKTVTRNPFIVHNMYVIGNGYKYLVSATMKDEGTKTSDKEKNFDNMINSFKLDGSAQSKYLEKITPVEELFKIDDVKTVKMKKYNFEAKLTKVWDISRDTDVYYGRYYDSFYNDRSRENISNNEYINAYDSSINMLLSMSVELNSNDINKFIMDNFERYTKDDEINMGLAKVDIKSSSYNGAQIFCIQKKYDLNEVNKFVNEDATKIYDLEKLRDEYEYIVKIGKDVYRESISIPTANTTQYNVERINFIWQNSLINNINYGKLDLKWKQHKLEEFNKNKL